MKSKNKNQEFDKRAFRVYIGDWDISKANILAFVLGGSLSVIDGYVLNEDSANSKLTHPKVKDRFITVTSKLDSSRYTIVNFDLYVDGKLRHDVLWFNIKPKSRSYAIHSQYSFVDPISFLATLGWFFLVLLTAGLATFFLLYRYKHSVEITRRLFRTMQAKIYQIYRGGSSTLKLEPAPQVPTIEEFFVESEVRENLERNKDVSEPKSEPALGSNAPMDLDELSAYLEKLGIDVSVEPAFDFSFLTGSKVFKGYSVVETQAPKPPISISEEPSLSELSEAEVDDKHTVDLPPEDTKESSNSKSKTTGRNPRVIRKKRKEVVEA